jgi:hypothetical protein
MISPVVSMLSLGPIPPPPPPPFDVFTVIDGGGQVAIQQGDEFVTSEYVSSHLREGSFTCAASMAALLFLFRIDNGIDDKGSFIVGFKFTKIDGEAHT